MSISHPILELVRFAYGAERLPCRQCNETSQELAIALPCFHLFHAECAPAPLAICPFDGSRIQRTLTEQQIIEAATKIQAAVRGWLVRKPELEAETPSSPNRVPDFSDMQLDMMARLCNISREELEERLEGYAADLEAIRTEEPRDVGVWEIDDVASLTEEELTRLAALTDLSDRSK